MIDDIVPPQGLLDRYQTELVERLQPRQVSKRICAIRVHHQRNFWKSLADSRQRFHVPARLDLDLNSLIACLQVLLNLLQQLLDTLLDPYRNPTKHFFPCATHQTCERS